MRRHHKEHNGQAVLYSQRGIPEMLRKMTEPLGEVCSVTRKLLRRGLGFQTSRHVNVFFPAKGRILFEQPSYILHNMKTYWGSGNHGPRSLSPDTSKRGPALCTGRLIHGETALV